MLSTRSRADERALNMTSYMFMSFAVLQLCRAASSHGMSVTEYTLPEFPASHAFSFAWWPSALPPFTTTMPRRAP